MLSAFKPYIYGTVIVAVITSIGFAINTFHYKPISDLEKSNAVKERFIIDSAKKHRELIEAYEKNFNEMYDKLYMCEQNTTKKKLDGIIEGLGGNDEADVIIDFSNILY